MTTTEIQGYVAAALAADTFCEHIALCGMFDAIRVGTRNGRLASRWQVDCATALKGFVSDPTLRARIDVFLHRYEQRIIELGVWL